jgi:sigma-B regulation protein RsbU (phosphoserine phosphatase)
MGKLKILRAAVLLPESSGIWRVALSKGKMDLRTIPGPEKLEEIKLLDPENGSEKALCDTGFRYCLPVNYQDRTFAAICLGKTLSDRHLDTVEKHYAGLVGTIAANALQNAENRLSLRQAKNEADRRNLLLTTLFEISRDFSSLLSRDQILQMLAHRLMGQLMVSRFAIFANRDDDAPEAIVNRFSLETDAGLIEKLDSINEIAYVDNIPKAGEFLKRVDARVVSPMKVQGKVKGYMVIGKKLSGEKFTDADLLFVEALGNTAIAALENERLFIEEVEKKRMESELDVALGIQENLLPRETPDSEKFEFHGFSRPSRYVGDYFDFIRLENDRIIVAIGDVSGKGMPASLLMANVQAALRALAPLDLDLKEIIVRINSIVYRNTSADKFVTFFIALLDLNTGRMQYINAGHNPPALFRSDGGLELLTEGGIILGIMDGTEDFDTGTIEIARGDLVIMYTDGITEALSPANEEYGEDRMTAVINAKRNGSIKKIMDEVVADVRLHARGAEQYDDMTMVGIKAK